MPFKCKNPECGKIFPVPGRISEEKRPAQGFIPDIVRRIVEKPCCPHCEHIDFEEIRP